MWASGRAKLALTASVEREPHDKGLWNCRSSDFWIEKFWTDRKQYAGTAGLEPRHFCAHIVTFQSALFSHFYVKKVHQASGSVRDKPRKSHFLGSVRVPSCLVYSGAAQEGFGIRPLPTRAGPRFITPLSSPSMIFLPSKKKKKKTAIKAIFKASVAVSCCSPGRRKSQDVTNEHK